MFQWSFQIILYDFYVIVLSCIYPPKHWSQLYKIMGSDPPWIDFIPSQDPAARHLHQLKSQQMPSIWNRCSDLMLLDVMFDCFPETFGQFCFPMISECNLSQSNIIYQMRCSLYGFDMQRHEQVFTRRLKRLRTRKRRQRLQMPKALECCLECQVRQIRYDDKVW